MAMQLQNPFPTEILFETKSHWYCWKCGGNENLQLHHIVGRSSNSRLNGCVLCQKCHSKVTHSQEEEKNFCNLSQMFWLSKNYKLVAKDERLFEKNPHLKKIII